MNSEERWRADRLGCDSHLNSEQDEGMGYVLATIAKWLIGGATIAVLVIGAVVYIKSL